jgi:hypothetical protein
MAITSASEENVANTTAIVAFESTKGWGMAIDENVRRIPSIADGGDDDGTDDDGTVVLCKE